MTHHAIDPAPAPDRARESEDEKMAQGVANCTNLR